MEAKIYDRMNKMQLIESAKELGVTIDESLSKREIIAILEGGAQVKTGTNVAPAQTEPALADSETDIDQADESDSNESDPSNPKSRVSSEIELRRAKSKKVPAGSTSVNDVINSRRQVRGMKGKFSVKDEIAKRRGVI